MTDDSGFNPEHNGTKLVTWTGRNGKPKSAILHTETANDPEKFRQWCEWNGYPQPENPA